MASGLFEILLIEDDPGDADLTREYLAEAKFALNLNVVEDGVKAMAYLRQENEYASATRPDLILLDLNLPKKDGKEMLHDQGYSVLRLYVIARRILPKQSPACNTGIASSTALPRNDTRRIFRTEQPWLHNIKNDLNLRRIPKL